MSHVPLPAPGFLADVNSNDLGDPISVHQATKRDAASALASDLDDGHVVPLSRVTKGGVETERLGFAAPLGLLDDRAKRSAGAFPWSEVRRNLREAVETARIRKEAVVVHGLRTEHGDSVPFAIVPSDAAPPFVPQAEIQQGALHERQTVALEGMKEAWTRIADVVERRFNNA